MKRLSKLFLLNWFYYSVQLVEFEDINFLTGKNSAGKSTLIDALEIVLLGEVSSKNFNKAADEKSQRTLEGYLRTDLSREHPRSRVGKEFNSYIVCECYDDVKDSRFVQGVVFSCGQDGSHRHDFFTFRGAFAESVFVTDNRPRTKSELRQELKARFSTSYRIYDTDKNYRESILAMWNVHNAQVFSLLKKAVSFRPSKTSRSSSPKTSATSRTTPTSPPCSRTSAITSASSTWQKSRRRRSGALWK